MTRNCNAGNWAEQDRQVHEHRPGDPVGLRLRPDAPEQVVGDHDQQRGQHHGREQPPEDRALERQLEDVEADVAPELLVPLAERHPVAPQQERLPEPGGLEPDHEPEEDGDGDPERAHVRAEHRPVLVGATRAGDPDRPVAGRDPVDDEEVDPDDQGGADPGDEPERHLGREPSPEHARLVDLTEPEQVGVEAGEAARGNERGDHDREQEQHPSARGPANRCDQGCRPLSGVRLSSGSPAEGADKPLDHGQMPRR
jgi:hypothetical protein